MFKTAIMIGLASLGVIATAPAMAHGNNDHDYNHGPSFNIRIIPPPPPRPRCVPGFVVDDMQASQAAQIRDGRRNGDLTYSEVNNLNDQQNRIAQLENRMRRDGCMTLNERDDLVTRLEQAARDIWRQRHNNEYRGQNDRYRWNDRYNRWDDNHHHSDRH